MEEWHEKIDSYDWDHSPIHMPKMLPQRSKGHRKGHHGKGHPSESSLKLSTRVREGAVRTELASSLQVVPGLWKQAGSQGSSSNKWNIMESLSKKEGAGFFQQMDRGWQEKRGPQAQQQGLTCLK